MQMYSFNQVIFEKGLKLTTMRTRTCLSPCRRHHMRDRDSRTPWSQLLPSPAVQCLYYWSVDSVTTYKLLLVTQTSSTKLLPSAPIPNYFCCKTVLLQAGATWSHVSGQNVSLQNSTLLHLLEIERVYLQKQAQVCYKSTKQTSQLSFSVAKLMR